MAMVEDAQDNKAQPERFITRFARVYTPVVCGIAVLVAVIPPLLGWGSWSTFIHKALAFLVISCPCALVISVPLSFFSGIGCASHNGILMKGSNYLELLAKAEIAAFDKTGTLTKGEFSVTEMSCADGVSQEHLLEVAAYCESQSTHPLAKSILKAYGKPVDGSRLAGIEEISGNGIRAVLDGKTALVGKAELLDGVAVTTQTSGTTVVCVACDGQYLGCIRKEFSLLRPRFDIDYNGWAVQGDWMGWDYTITGPSGQRIATVSKELLRMTDTYVLEVKGPANALHVLLFALAMDAEKCSRN